MLHLAGNWSYWLKDSLKDIFVSVIPSWHLIQIKNSKGASVLKLCCSTTWRCHNLCYLLSIPQSSFYHQCAGEQLWLCCAEPCSSSGPRWTFPSMGTLRPPGWEGGCRPAARAHGAGLREVPACSLPTEWARPQGPLLIWGHSDTQDGSHPPLQVSLCQNRNQAEK